MKKSKVANLNVNVLLCHYLRDCRLEADVTQAEISRIGGYKTAQYASNMERAQCVPSFKMIAVYIMMCQAKPERIAALEKVHFADRVSLAYNDLAKELKKRKIKEIV